MWGPPVPRASLTERSSSLSASGSSGCSCRPDTAEREAESGEQCRRAGGQDCVHHGDGATLSWTLALAGIRSPWPGEALTAGQRAVSQDWGSADEVTDSTDLDQESYQTQQQSQRQNPEGKPGPELRQHPAQNIPARDTNSTTCKRRGGSGRAEEQSQGRRCPRGPQRLHPTQSSGQPSGFVQKTKGNTFKELMGNRTHQ